MQPTSKSAFTLVEMAVVTFILGLLVSIAAPTYVNQTRRGRETALKASLQQLRTAISSFHADTGLYPSALSDLSVTTSPAAGRSPVGVSTPINLPDWRGPYLDSLPTDPISSSDWIYSSSGSTTGTVKSGSSGNDLAGNPYGGY